MMEDDMVAGKLLDLAAVAANSAAAGFAAPNAESEGEEEDTCNWSRAGSGATGVYEECEGSEGDEEDNGVGGKQKRALPTDSERRARNRERNRLHARKTRQRKKQHVQELQLKIWGLRQERQRLLQLSTDHRTAGVLLALSCSPKQCIQGAGPLSAGSPRVPPALKLSDTATKAAAGSTCSSRDWSREIASHEEALRRITQEFESMDGSQQLGDEEGETGALTAVRGRAQSSSSNSSSSGGGGGGKGSSRGFKGTLSDRTALRRERNRMHAKRTRNRKKLFVEACSVMIDKMKVENAQLEHEIRASGIHLPQEDWRDDVRETVPEEPLPEYLAALWDFAEGKSHNPKTSTVATSANSSSSASTTTSPAASPATPKTSSGGAARQSRQISSSSSSSSSSFSGASSSRCSSTSSRQQQQQQQQKQQEGVSTTNATKAPRQPPFSPGSESSSALGLSVLPTAASAVGDGAIAASTPGQALEDASALCAFMEAAQTRSAKRARVGPSMQQQQQQQPRGWSDHGSTTSESRGGSEFSEEDTSNERKSAIGNSGKGASSREAGVLLSPALWTSRQVLERYVLPRQQLLQG